jgi:hypothetical protein
MIFTFKLWNRFLTPFIAHPLHNRWTTWRHIDRSRQQQTRLERRVLIAGILVFLIGAGVLRVSDTTPWMVLTVGLPLVIVSTGVPIIMLTIGTIYGLTCAVTVASNIAYEKSQGRLALLRLTHYGTAGAVWSITTLTVQNQPLLTRIRTLLRPLYGLTIFVIGFPTLLLFLPTTFVDVSVLWETEFDNYLNIMLLVIFTGLDYFQSGNLGAIAGMSVATLEDNALNGGAGGRGAALFLTLQVVSFMVTSLVCLFFLPSLAGDELIRYTLLCIVTTLGCREVLLIVAWSAVGGLVESGSGELEAVAHIRARSLPFRSAGR